MARFRKRPIVVEAEQWFPDDHIAIGYDHFGVEYTVCDRSIQTPEGPMRVSPGDWIITGIAGEKYPCKPDIFARTYDPVRDEIVYERGFGPGDGDSRVIEPANG